MTIDDYKLLYALQINTIGIGLNDVDDSREGIRKIALVTFDQNKTLRAIERIDT